LKLKKGEKSRFFSPHSNWKIFLLVKDIEKRFSVPNSGI
jgi:hypothetical protein